VKLLFCQACGERLVNRKPDRGRCRNNRCRYYDEDRPLSEFGKKPRHQPEIQYVDRVTKSKPEIEVVLIEKPQPPPARIEPRREPKQQRPPEPQPLVQLKEPKQSPMAFIINRAKVATKQEPLAWSALVALTAIPLAALVGLIYYELAEIVKWLLEARLSKR